MDGLGLPATVTLAFAGLCGAWVFAAISPIRESYWRALASISVGFAASVFLAPAVWWYWGWENIHAQHATAFCVGLLGNPVCRAILSDGTAAAATAVKDAIARLFNLPKNGDDNGAKPRGKHPRPDSDVPTGS